jgi:hypothetical protein
MLYLLELKANGIIEREIVPPIKELNVRSATVSETGGIVPAFPINTNGDIKMDRHDQELLDKQMRMLTPPRNDGVIVVLLAAMFLVGITLGSVLSEPKTAPIQIASVE